MDLLVIVYRIDPLAVRDLKVRTDTFNTLNRQ